MKFLLSSTGSLASIVIAVFAGLIVLFSILVNFGFAVLIYFFFILSMAMLIATDNLSNSKTVVAALVATFFAVSTPVVLFYIASSPILVQGMEPFKIGTGTHWATEVSPFTPAVVLFVSMLHILCWLISALFLFIATKSVPSLNSVLVNVWNFGPDGMKRLRLLIVGATAVVAALAGFVTTLQ